MATSSPATSATSTRPRVAFLYTHASPLSCEGEYLAKYVGLALASTGATSKVAVVAVDVNQSSTTATTKTETPQEKKTQDGNVDDNETAVIRADGVVFKRSQIKVQDAYLETSDIRQLQDCHVWVLCLDTASAFNALQFVQKRVSSGEKSGAPKKRVIISLQPALRQLRELENMFPKDTVIHGGACFHLTKNKHGVLYPLSHGCYYMERLSSEKASALFALDLIEATGFQVLSRKNLQALKWGHTMVRLFYYVNALTGQSVRESLQDRAMRLVYLEMLYEMDSLFTSITTDLNDSSTDTSSKQQAGPRSSWAPDCSPCTYLSIHALMVLLPLPDWLFNTVVLQTVDLGLTASATGYSTIHRDVAARRETEFWSEFKDVFDLAGRRAIELPALATLKHTLTTLTQRHASPHTNATLSGRGLLSEIKSSPQSRAVSRTFFLKVILTVVATMVLVLYFVVKP